MDDRPTKRDRGSGTPVVATLAIVVIVAPFLYVLSIGPAAWLVNTGRLNDDEGSVVVRFYTPLILAAESCQRVDDSLQWYVTLWEPPRAPQVVVPNLAPAPALAAPVALPARS
jgi:hypothetical protein